MYTNYPLRCSGHNYTCVSLSTSQPIGREPLTRAHATDEETLVTRWRASPEEGGVPHLLVHEQTDADWQLKDAAHEPPNLLPLT